MTFTLHQNFIANARGITFEDGGGVTWSLNSNSNQITANASGGGAVAGNPTASVGLAAVNGSAATWMRSDAAPALSQAIIPTWSGLHTFGAGLTVSAGAVTISTHTLALSANATVGGTNTGDQVLPTGANPSASVALSAINGTATTFMRSDAAPPINVAITPTWTGKHIWSTGNGNNVSLQVSGDVDIGVAGSSALSAAARAILYLNNTDAGIEFASAGSTQSYLYASTSELRIATLTNIPLNFYQNNSIAIAITGPTTTGTQTATFLATNKPGSATGAPVAWLPVKTAAGVTGYIPVFGA